MDIFSTEYAEEQDRQDTLSHLRKEFHIPSRADIRSHTSIDSAADDKEPCSYLCGNSLGLQPTKTALYAREYLQTWATKGVYGHFTKSPGQTLPPWVDVDERIAPDMAKIVGADKGEIAVMQTLTANLHLALCSFYQPTKERYKIIIEGKAFPSDHYAIESQLQLHNLDPKNAMVMLVPNTPMRQTLSTQHILRVIDENATSTAVLLLPGIQFYTGQLFDISKITAHAQSKGIIVGWDLAHAVGNVPLSLHDWNVDFAVWCSYKYMNCGPGAIGGMFIHSHHTSVIEASSGSSNSTLTYRPRLAGWWGSSKSSRFQMTNKFTPIPGAAGFQLSNPSVADMTALRASLDVYNMTTISSLREKSLKLTRYLEQLLQAICTTNDENPNSNGNGSSSVVKVDRGTFEIITPSDPTQRGAQLSIRLAPKTLEEVLGVLEAEAIVVDERKPDVIRVAPAPLYNTFADVLRFVTVFRDACVSAAGKRRASSVSLRNRPVLLGAAGEVQSSGVE